MANDRISNSDVAKFLEDEYGYTPQLEDFMLDFGEEKLSSRPWQDKIVNEYLPEADRWYRQHPIWPFSNTPSEWINRKDPNYQESIYQAPLASVDLTGIGSITKVGPRAVRWWSALERALDRPQLAQAKSMKGRSLLKMLQRFGTSAEEIRWTGIKDYIETRGLDEPADMAVIRDLAEVNKIRLNDINLGERNVPDALLRKKEFLAEKARATLDKIYRSSDGSMDIYSQARGLDPEDFAAWMNKQPLNLSRTDVAAAREQGVSKMDYARGKIKDIINLQEQYNSEYSDYAKLENTASKLLRQFGAKHQGYVADQPLPAADDFYNFLVQLKHGGEPVEGGAHYAYPDVLVGVLADVRKTMSGKTGFHLQEWQSDWSKRIRAYGVKREMPPSIVQQLEKLKLANEKNETDYWDIRAERNVAYDKYRAVQRDDLDHNVIMNFRRRWRELSQKHSDIYEQGRAIRAQIREIEEAYPQRGMPDMPYQDSEALKLGLKKALWEAARSEADVFTWTRGEDLHKFRVGNRRDQKWPYFIYDEFAPKAIKSILKEVGVKPEFFTPENREKYPGNWQLKRGENYINTRERYQEVTDRLEEIIQDAEIDDLDPATHPAWEDLTIERRELRRTLGEEEDIGFDVHGFRMTPEDRKTILNKGFKKSALDLDFLRMLA